MSGRNEFDEVTFWARVELKQGPTKVSRRIEAPGVDADQAKERMLNALREVWPGWAVAFILEPQRGTR